MNQCDSFSAPVPRGLDLPALLFHTTTVLCSLLQKNTSQTDKAQFRLNSCALPPPRGVVSDMGKIFAAWLIAENSRKFTAFMRKE